jgi:hypothetical protein
VKTLNFSAMANNVPTSIDVACTMRTTRAFLCAWLRVDNAAQICSEFSHSLLGGNDGMRSALRRMSISMRRITAAPNPPYGIRN